ncbi:NAD(+) diphosphatase [Marinobacter nanhaiticus D15-8W]|uniref:NAD(+) diphosphatase n=1 Tax=Marinobacter nanhaiticus D15-8W TaxID=626887 RepID=N6W8U1_9GAMM|nr:NAD(+) diphosphatase [Marinobacter nanhaiticus]ENO16659.1 NAD(+) diphosphatase [Marinobacter nanhaiticus D15-8W]BES72460.1 NAD(+) diphosphatase [Marinobacter nanhaiticus D15-8W]
MSGWVPGWSEEPPRAGDGLVLARGSKIVTSSGGWLHEALAPEADVVADDPAIFLGHLEGRRIFVARAQEPAEEQVLALRDALLGSDPLQAGVLNTASQVLQWQIDHRYCGRCGSVTRMHARERAKWCETCEIPFYPRLAPCVIVLIRDGDKLFLARSSRHKHGFYSLIAGFIEPGESAEEAVQREVFEETGLYVQNIRYHASQPWPFPHQLMLGYYADFAGGELRLQEDELAAADWFAPDALPPYPPENTIAGRLINQALAEIRS